MEIKFEMIYYDIFSLLTLFTASSFHAFRWQSSEKKKLFFQKNK